MYMTDHGRQRIHERIGLSKKSAEKQAQKALAYGLTHAECKSGLKRYIDKLYLDHGTCNGFRVYHHYVYLFKGDAMVTVLPLPRQFNEMADKLQRAKKVHLSSV